MKPTVLLVDDHAVVRDGLASLLAITGNYGDIAHAAGGEGAIAVAQDISPDIIVIDLLMPNMPTAGAIRILRNVSPRSAIVVLTSSEDRQAAFAALEAGAQSFLLKSMSGDEILDAMEHIAAGTPVIHPSVTSGIVDLLRTRGSTRHDPFRSLTPREVDVLVELAKGASNVKIAATLDITERTVKAHISSVFAKLGLGDRTEAVAFAWRHGLVTPADTD
jgi:two-component system, NarL family, response regulator LiaR